LLDSPQVNESEEAGKEKGARESEEAGKEEGARET